MLSLLLMMLFVVPWNSFHQSPYSSSAPPTRFLRRGTFAYDCFLFFFLFLQFPSHFSLMRPCASSKEAVVAAAVAAVLKLREEDRLLLLLLLPMPLLLLLPTPLLLKLDFVEESSPSSSSLWSFPSSFSEGIIILLLLLLLQLPAVLSTEEVTTIEGATKLHAKEEEGCAIGETLSSQALACCLVGHFVLLLLLHPLLLLPPLLLLLEDLHCFPCCCCCCFLSSAALLAT